MKNILVLGPFIGKSSIGGVTVSFDYAMRLLRGENIEFRNINHSHIGVIGLLKNLVYIFLWALKNNGHVSLHCTKNAFLTYGVFLWVLRIAFGVEYSIRKFAGAFDSYFLGSSKVIQLLIKKVLAGSHSNFFQTESLVGFFERYNQRTFFMPTSRIPKAIPRSKRYSKRFVYIGRICQAKGIPELVDAFNEIADDGFNLSIYGNIDSDIDHSELSGFYKGLLDPSDVQHTIQDYDVLILPSKWNYEGFPGVIIESFLTGTPVVASAIGGIAELVEDNYNGILISRVSAQTIIAAVKSINAEMHCEMAKNCSKHAKRYNAELVYSDYLKSISVVS